MSEADICIGIFGGGGVGKTAICIQYIKGQFTEGYIPTIEDEYLKTIEYEGKNLTIDIVDTAGQDDFKEMRSRYYGSVHAIIFVYSILERKTLAEVEEMYADAIKFSGKDHIPCVLCGNKEDLRGQDENPVTESEGQELARKLGCKLIPTSAKTGQGVTEAFTEAIKQYKGAGTKTDKGTRKKEGGSCCEVA